MNDENPFKLPNTENVVATENKTKHNVAIIIAMYAWILITFFINGAIAQVFLNITGIQAKNILILFGREVLVVYLIISSLALFKCKINTYAITTSILTMTILLRTYIDCVIYGSMKGLLNIWLDFSVLALVTAYLYVLESFLMRKIIFHKRARAPRDLNVRCKT